MLKLLKYDFKIIAKSLIPYYLILLLLAFITKLLNKLSDLTNVISIISTPIKILFIILLIGIIFYTFIILIKYFYTNIFKDEGYLTNTLPVSKNNILLSKFICSVTYLVISTIILILSIYIGFNNIDKIIDFFNSLITTLNYKPSTVYIYTLILIFLTYVNYILFVFLSISLGQTSNNSKILFTLIYGLVVYTITQLISLIGLGIMLLFDPSIINNINNNNVSLNVLNNYFILSIVLTIIISIGYYIITKFILERKLNLE